MFYNGSNLPFTNPYLNPYQYPLNVIGIKSTLNKRTVQVIFDAIGIIICTIVFIIVNFAMDPRIQYLTCDMSDISFPVLSDTVPYKAVLIFGLFGPAIVIFLVEFGNAKLYPNQDSFSIPPVELIRKFYIYVFHAESLFLFGLSIVTLITEIGKRWIGRLTPHFLAVCNPDLTNITCHDQITQTIYNSIYTGNNFCRGSASDVKLARLSFPSGDASFSFYTMGFLIIYLEARLQFIRLRYLKALIQLTAFIAAFVTSISKIVDYTHHGSDVIGGIVIGIAVAISITYYIGAVLWETDWFDVVTGNETRFKARYYDFDSRRFIHTSS